MIAESTPWKQELSRNLELVKRWSTKSHTQRGYFLVERSIFLTGFIVRKLIENRKVTDRIRNKSVRCGSFKPLRPLSDRVSRFSGVYDVGREYDLSNHQKLTLSLFDLSSEIMHSYAFELEVDGHEALIAFYVNSYRNQDNRLLRVDLSSYLDAVQAAVSDRVMKMRIWKDNNTGRIHAVLN
jgi:hypothetical protein